MCVLEGRRDRIKARARALSLRSLLLILAAEEASNVAARTLCALADLAGASLSTGAHGTGVAAAVVLAASLGAVDALLGDVVTDWL